MNIERAIVLAILVLIFLTVLFVVFEPLVDRR